MVRRVTILLAAAGIAATAAAAADVPRLPAAGRVFSDRATFLGATEQGLEQTEQFWWNADLGWYNSRPGTTDAQPLPSLWYAFPLFEAKAAVALAHPTAANKLAVEAFATKAENYWDPTIASGAGAFSWYYGLRGTGNAYFDDNGWWGIAFVDAYRATGDKRWLKSAAHALLFIDRFGWDRTSGGIWWDMAHRHKTAEPLAAGAMIAAELYGITRQVRYLKIAKKYIAWADAKTRNPAQHGLYGRSDTDATVMDYVQGMMIAAQSSLCGSTGVKMYCTRSEEIAAASLEEFPILADWAPETDVIYLRGLMDLYRRDRNPRWYAVGYANARAALANARDGQGLWSKRWDGGWTLPGAIYTQAATLQLFAWVADADPPG
ncbi:MAG: glycoside hydrolase family 76 protein [Gaiellaceae bacterium]